MIIDSGCVEQSLQALDKLAFLPVGCGVNLFAGVPNLTGGAGPVFCGIKGAAAGCCWGTGGTGGIGGGAWPNPDLPNPLTPVFWVWSAGGSMELTPVCCDWRELWN